MSTRTKASSSSNKTLMFDDGAVQFRQRLVVSILSHRPLLIRNIRSDDIEAPGLREYEASFLRLLDRMTNGSVVEINSTGTQLRFKPGVLIGGSIEHKCPISSPSATSPAVVSMNPVHHLDDLPYDDDAFDKTARSVGWFMEGILPLACFGKESLDLTLFGITDGACLYDPSVDYIQTAMLPLLTRFGIGSNEDFGPPPSIKILQRYAPSTLSNNQKSDDTTHTTNSNHKLGCVRFYCPIVKELKPIDFTDMGKIKRVRGTVVSCRIPPSSAARVAHSTKGMLHRLLPDVWIKTDVQSGPHPCLGLCLAAESTTGVVLAAETSLDAQKQRKARAVQNQDGSHDKIRSNNSQTATTSTVMLPEDLGIQGAVLLLEEIQRGGCIDTGVQSIAFLLMCLCPEDVSRIRIGSLSSYSITSLRLFKLAFNIEFKIKADEISKTVLLSCLGSGYRNMAKASS